MTGMKIRQKRLLKSNVEIKEKYMKKVIITLSLVVCIFVGTQRKAEAGLYTINSIVMAPVDGAASGLGGVMIGGFIGVGMGLFGGASIIWEQMGNLLSGERDLNVLSLLLGIGLVIVDESTHNLSYKELSIEQAAKLNLNMSELESYNSEVDLINLVMEEVEYEIVNAYQQLDKFDFNKRSKEISDDYKSYLSEDTLSALKKISTVTKK